MEVSYGKEPFDLRLMLLCLGRNLWKILAVTVAGMVLFGGGYYVKNVLLQPDPGYAASSTYKVEYFENPNAAGAYYINAATWDSLIHTGEFLDGVETHLQEAADRGETESAEVQCTFRHTSFRFQYSRDESHPAGSCGERGTGSSGGRDHVQ